MEVTLASGRRAVFDIDTDATGPAYFVLSVSRSGSTLLNRVVEALAAANERPFIEMGTVFFDANISEGEFTHDPELLGLIRPGNAYGGFRVLPPVLAWSPEFLGGRKVLMVRDPRDALVSRYYSNGWSHPIPDASNDGDDVTALMVQLRDQVRATPIDEWVLKAIRHARRSLMAYVPLRHDPTVLVLRYEDYIFEKPTLIARIADHFGWSADEATVERILSWAEVEGHDDPAEHVRHVTPGDHRQKLSADTIYRLNRLLEDVMVPFDYAA